MRSESKFLLSDIKTPKQETSLSYSLRHAIFYRINIRDDRGSVKLHLKHTQLQATS